jgi:hypothetical protein
MHTNCKTLSSRCTKPACANHRVIPTPIRGVTTIFARASDAIAPRGKGSPDRTRKQARALPRHIRPIGTHAAPTKVAVSRTKASGGCPSGAMGRKRGLKLDDGGRKSALSGSTSAITIANTITIGQGLSNSFKICGERGTRWSQREERGSVGCRRSSGEEAGERQILLSQIIIDVGAAAFPMGVF